MKIRACVFALFLVAATTFPLSAQDLPAADALIDGYVEAMGGRDTFLANSSVRNVGTVTMVGMGIDGTFELIASAEDQFRMSINLPGVGEIVAGFDGENGWSTNPLMGATVMQGEELAQARDNSAWLAQIRDSSLVPVRETVGEAQFAGQSCWRVRLEWASGRETFDCYSKQSGLLVATEATEVSAMGAVPTVAIYEAYREVEGLRVPARITQSAAGQTLDIQITEVELNSVPPSAFDPPPAVATLLGTGGGD